jgi:3-hydroxybutyryl-CoA dehydrogenase
MTLKDIKRILVIGSGTMGLQIAIQSAMNGYNVRIFVRNPKKNEIVWKSIHRSTDWIVRLKILTREKADEMLKRLYTTNNPADAAENVDILSESVPEIPSLKKEIFEQFNKLCPERTIFTTDTSSLLPSMLAENTGRPSKFIALHFNNPVWITKTADVMPHPGTSEDVFNLIVEFSRSIGLIPIILKTEHPGYIINTLLIGLMESSMSLVVSGVATPQQVDKSWMATMKTPIGPFGIMDNNGLDVGWEMRVKNTEKSGDKVALATVKYMKENFIDKGHLGRKTGKGFYNYPHPEYKHPDFMK